MVLRRSSIHHRMSKPIYFATRRLLIFIIRVLINEDIDAIIQRGEERTVELNSRYEGLNFEDLSNFKSEASVQQWEGEDFRSGVSISKRYRSCPN